MLIVQTHLPGYVNDYDKLKDAGAEVVVCTSVNDPFVMAAWAEINHASGKVPNPNAACCFHSSTSSMSHALVAATSPFVQTERADYVDAELHHWACRRFACWQTRRPSSPRRWALTLTPRRSSAQCAARGAPLVASCGPHQQAWTTSAFCT